MLFVCKVTCDEIDFCGSTSKVEASTRQADASVTTETNWARADARVKDAWKNLRNLPECVPVLVPQGHIVQRGDTAQMRKRAVLVERPVILARLLL
jgi:hypothetical protein